MQKPVIGYKQIRKKATKPHPVPPHSQNSLILQPSLQVSFTTIKKHHEIPLIQIDRNTSNYITRSPIIKYNTSRSKYQETSREKDCNKFSVLLESKGYSNNGNSAKKKCQQLSFRTISNSSKYRVSTQKKQIQTDRFQTKIKTLQGIGINKSKSTRNKHLNSSRNNPTETSLTNLKYKLVISPLTIKNANKIKPLIYHNKNNKVLEHASIRSQYDLVNMSKNNQSIDFDMSPGI